MPVAQIFFLYLLILLQALHHLQHCVWKIMRLTEWGKMLQEVLRNAGLFPTDVVLPNNLLAAKVSHTRLASR